MKKLGVICLTALLLACSDSPSQGDLAREMERSLNETFGMAFVEVENFNKLAGQLTESGEYIATISYDMLFTRSLSDIEAELQASDDRHAPMVGMGLGMAFGNFNKGEIKAVPQADYTFVQTEQGWQLKK